MTQELIYTSAEKGLRLGSRGFCTVASSAGMAKPLADRLEALSGYRHLHPPGSATGHLNPVNFSYVTFKFSGSTYYLLSRIADAGLDHTQRSNKLAHHIVLSSSELASAGPAWIALQPDFFVTQWNEEPQIISKSHPIPQGTLSPAVCSAWKAASGDAGWAGVLAETATTGKDAYVIYPVGMNVLPLVVEAQSLLSTSQRWVATFSTYYMKLPPGVECRWRFVPDGTPEAQLARRSPGQVVIDLCSKLGSPAVSPLVTVARTGKSESTSRLPNVSLEPAIPTLSPEMAADPTHSSAPYAMDAGVALPPTLPARVVKKTSRSMEPDRNRQFSKALIIAGIFLLGLIIAGVVYGIYGSKSSDKIAYQNQSAVKVASEPHAAISNAEDERSKKRKEAKRNAEEERIKKEEDAKRIAEVERIKKEEEAKQKAEEAALALNAERDKFLKSWAGLHLRPLGSFPGSGNSLSNKSILSETQLGTAPTKANIAIFGLKPSTKADQANNRVVVSSKIDYAPDGKIVARDKTIAEIKGLQSDLGSEYSSIDLTINNQCRVTEWEQLRFSCIRLSPIDNTILPAFFYFNAPVSHEPFAIQTSEFVSKYPLQSTADKLPLIPSYQSAFFRVIVSSGVANSNFETTTFEFDLNDGSAKNRKPFGAHLGGYATVEIDRSEIGDTIVVSVDIRIRGSDGRDRTLKRFMEMEVSRHRDSINNFMSQAPQRLRQILTKKIKANDQVSSMEEKVKALNLEQISRLEEILLNPSFHFDAEEQHIASTIQSIGYMVPAPASMGTLKNLQDEVDGLKVKVSVFRRIPLDKEGEFVDVPAFVPVEE